MSPSTWGPPTWVFIHVLAAKVKEQNFPMIGHTLLSVIRQICYNLPCPNSVLIAAKARILGLDPT